MSVPSSRPPSPSRLTITNVGWPRKLWVAGQIEFRSQVSPSRLMMHLSQAFASDWSLSRPLQVRYQFREVAHGFRLAVIRGAGPAWFNPGPVFESSLTPLDNGSFVSGQLRMPYEAIYRIATFVALGIVGMVTSWLAGFAGGVVVFSGFVLVPFAYMRLLALPEALTALSSVLASALEELPSARQGEA